jgi:phosphoglycerol transferase MdoB-like AlkP superfamily enzyme
MHSQLLTPFRTNWLFTLIAGCTFLLTLYLFAMVMESLGGFSSVFPGFQFPEILIVLYLYALFYSMLKPHRLRPVLAGLPIFLLYVVHDLFYLAFGKVFRLINAAELPELLQVLPISYDAVLVVITATPIALFLSKLDVPSAKKYILWLMPLILITLAVKLTPNAFAHGFEQVAREIITYSDSKSVESNGRIAMMIYREAQRSSSLEQLEPYHDRKAYEQKFASLIDGLRPDLDKRNVHLIVLESFLDPRLFRDLKFSASPVHPSFQKLFGDQLGLSISPVFGGGTAQAEFELLCGVPALEELSSVEFNVFTGAAAHCLPSQLKALGYRSVGSNTYKPNFFNELPAYQGMGFTESYFPQEFSGTTDSYLRFGDPGVEEYLFDRDLFAQNLGFVSRHMQQHPEQPMFNYLMTIYGHTPHILDPELRPEKIRLLSDYPDDHLTRSVNQFYYRSQAIAEFINRLIELDANSLIVLVSDHVPPLRNGPNTYKALQYEGNREGSYYYNRLAIIDRGKVITPPAVHHYDIPKFILNSLSGGTYCQAHPCNYLSTLNIPRLALLPEYLELMAHAAE